MQGLSAAQWHYDQQQPDDFEISDVDWTDADHRDLDADLAAERNDRRGEA